LSKRKKEKKMKKKTKIVNLTPHCVRIVMPDGSIREVPSAGIARLAVNIESAGEFDGIPLTKSVFGQPKGLPEPVPGTMYIVSGIMKSALTERTDLVVPNELVRDDKGAVIGCRSLGL